MKWKWGSGLRRGSAGVKLEPAELSWWGWCSWCAACALPLAAVGRCSRAGGEEKSVLDLPSGRPLFPFVCTFFFFFFISECFIFQKLSFYINLSARYIHSHCQNLHIKHL